MKKLFKILLILLLAITPVFALEDGRERESMQNYGVNKKWKINNSNLENVLRTPLVDASKKIYDYGDILTDEEENELFTLVGNFIEQTNMDMVILTVDMPYYSDSENETYASDFYDYNDFGIDFEHYSGVLLLRNKYDADPYFNVYTFGDAQLYFDYDRCENMLDNIYPFFRNKSYLEGFKLFISDFSNYYRNGKALSDYYVDDMGFIHKKYVMPIIPALFVGLIASIITIVVMIKKNKMIKKATEANDYIEDVKYNQKSDILTGSFTTHYTVSRSSGSSGGGGHSSHSGSSGGGHGGGGGRHG